MEETFLQASALQQKWEFDEFTSMEKWTQLLLIEHIWQSQKGDIPSYYPF
jgi:hypothetical protein